MNNIKLEQQILLNKPVPVLPAGLGRLLQAFDADSISHVELVEILSDFPSIAARLIFLANSAWASPRMPVENLETACIRLGLSMVRSVSISLCIASSFEALNRCPAFDVEYFWCSSLMTAEAATLLASCAIGTSVLNIATLHTAGLLHNLGLLWLAGTWPEQTSRALNLVAEDDSLTTRQALRSIMGTDYCEVGGMLGRSWNLPEVLVSAMGQHCCEDYPGSAYPCTVLVGYAAQLVSALQSGAETRPDVPEKIKFEFDPISLDVTYRKLRDKLNETRELARAMFSV